MYYSSVVSKARQESNMDKDTALLYFFKTKSYQKTIPNKSYADVLKFGKTIPVNVKSNASQFKENKCSDAVKECVKITTTETPVNQVNATTCFNTIYKREYQKPITLHNWFEAFHHIDTKDDIDIQSICHQDTYCDRNTVCKPTKSVQPQLGT